MSGGARVPGVYRLSSHDGLDLVHEYLDEAYELADINELLGIGSLNDDGGTLALDRREQRLLKVTADAQSFDHAPEFISMCLDIAALDPAPDDTTVRLVSVA
jgi:hypothetical protein